MEVVSKEKLYSIEQIKNIILNSIDGNISDVAVYKRINKMIATGGLSRIRDGQYVFNNKNKFDYELEYDNSLNILNKLNNRFDSTAKYIIYESTILNWFLNHLLAKSTVIVEVEKDLVESVFWFLKEEGYNNIMLNPSDDEYYIYNPYDGGGIIIKSMVSKAPINNKHHKITIEKMVVDIVCDKTLNMFFEGAEIPYMVEDILKNYKVKFDTVKNYAKRRHCLDKFMKFVPEEMKMFLCN